VDSAGNALLTGYTGSTDFPFTAGAFDTTPSGLIDAFVAKLDPTGSSLLYSTYIGGGDNDTGRSITTDSAGNAFVAGYTISADFPVTAGAFDTTYNSGDAFVAKLDLTGSSLLYSTYLGGGSSDGGYSIAVDSAGNAFVTGGTISADFPVTASAFDTTYNSGDAFVVKLGPVVVNFPPRAYNPGVQGFISSPGILHITDNTPELNWTYNDPDGDPQASYDSRVGTAPGLGNMWDSPATSGSATVVTYGGGALLRGADYYFGVKVNDSYSWSPEVEVKFHMNSIPNAPTTPITPAQSLTVPASSSQTVSWTTGGDNESDVITYDWQVSTDSTFASTLVQGIGIGTTSASFATTPSATYFWRVRARDDYEPANWSEYDDSPLGHWTFSTSPPPNTPPTVTITSPTGGEEFLKGSSQTITWTMTDDTTPNANLTIYINYTTGGVTSQLVAALKGQVSFAWTLPNIEANDVVVNITVIDSGGLKGWSQSDPITIKAPSSPPPDFLSQYWWLIVVIVAVVIALLLLALMKRRKPKEEKEEVQPPEPQNPPRSE
jgi:hypothetical protein